MSIPTDDATSLQGQLECWKQEAEELSNDPVVGGREKMAHRFWGRKFAAALHEQAVMAAVSVAMDGDGPHHVWVRVSETSAGKPCVADWMRPHAVTAMHPQPPSDGAWVKYTRADLLAGADKPPLSRSRFCAADDVGERLTILRQMSEELSMDAGSEHQEGASHEAVALLMKRASAIEAGIAGIQKALSVASTADTIRSRIKRIRERVKAPNYRPEATVFGADEREADALNWVLRHLGFDESPGIWEEVIDDDG